MRVLEINKDYNNDIKSYFNNTSKWKILDFGNPCNDLIKAGLPNLPLRMTKADFHTKVSKHSLNYENIKDFPKLLQTPLLIFHSKTVKGDYTVIVKREINNELLMISVSPNSQHEKIKLYNNINKITSIHSRNAKQLTNWTKEGLLIYADKKIKAFPILDFSFNCRQFEKTFKEIANITRKNGFSKFNTINGIQDNTYWRARLNLIQQTLPMLDDKERRLYSNGFIPTKHIKSFDKQTQNLSKEQSNEPLSFAELTSYSTWFAMHPEKIAGQETEASSIQFPIKLKGNKKDIEKMFASVFGDKVSDESEAEAEALAIALMLELELMDM